MTLIVSYSERKKPRWWKREALSQKIASKSPKILMPLTRVVVIKFTKKSQQWRKMAYWSKPREKALPVKPKRIKSLFILVSKSDLPIITKMSYRMLTSNHRAAKVSSIRPQAEWILSVTTATWLRWTSKEEWWVCLPSNWLHTSLHLEARHSHTDHSRLAMDLGWAILELS